IPYHRYIVACLFKDMVSEFCGSAFTIAACNGYDLAFSFVPEAKFYLTAYFYILFFYFFDNSCFIADAGAFYYASSFQNFFFCMLPFFKCYIIIPKHFLIVFLNSAFV